MKPPSNVPNPNLNQGSSEPSKLRLAVLMVPAVYPFITALLYVVTPLTEGWYIWQKTLVLTPVMVFLIAYVVTPFVRARLGWCIAVSRAQKSL